MSKNKPGYDTLYVRIPKEHKEIVKRMSRENMMSMAKFMTYVVSDLVKKKIKVEISNARKKK